VDTLIPWKEIFMAILVEKIETLIKEQDTANKG
jgi:hypothetical protein